MRSVLLLLPCALALAGGCYGISTDPGQGSASGAGGSSAGSGGQARGGRTFGTSGSSSGGSTAEGGANGGTSSGGGSGEIVCQADGSTVTIDKSCETMTDCITVQHATDCCGSYTVMGINAGAQATFTAMEMECAPLPICDCAPQWTTLEDGTKIPYRDTSYVIDCFDGQCQSAYPGATFACGTIICTELQYCTLIIGGQPDSGATPSCGALGDCKSCDCLPSSVACGCSQDDAGNLTVTCASP